VHFKHSNTALQKKQQVINFPYSIGAELAASYVQNVSVKLHVSFDP